MSFNPHAANCDRVRHNGEHLPIRNPDARGDAAMRAWRAERTRERVARQVEEAEAVRRFEEESRQRREEERVRMARQIEREREERQAAIVRARAARRADAESNVPPFPVDDLDSDGSDTTDDSSDDDASIAGQHGTSSDDEAVVADAIDGINAFHQERRQAAAAPHVQAQGQRVQQLRTTPRNPGIARNTVHPPRHANRHEADQDEFVVDPESRTAWAIPRSMLAAREEARGNTRPQPAPRVAVPQQALAVPPSVLAGQDEFVVDPESRTSWLVPQSVLDAREEAKGNTRPPLPRVAIPSAPDLAYFSTFSRWTAFQTQLEHTWGQMRARVRASPRARLIEGLYTWHNVADGSDRLLANASGLRDNVIRWRQDETVGEVALTTEVQLYAEQLRELRQLLFTGAQMMHDLGI